MAIPLDGLFWGGGLTIGGPIVFIRGFGLWRREAMPEATVYLLLDRFAPS